MNPGNRGTGGKDLVIIDISSKKIVRGGEHKLQDRMDWCTVVLW